MPQQLRMVITLLSCVLLLTSLAAVARPGDGLWSQQAAPATNERTLSADEAAAIARQRSGGRVLSAEPASSDGRTVYRVKILTPEGRVRVLSIDAEPPARRR